MFFQKEQEAGDYQNLVFCIMHEKRTDLQSAIDILAGMLEQRVVDYTYLKTQVPAFGPEIDSEIRRYFRALEHYLRGNVEWCYTSYRKAPSSAQLNTMADTVWIQGTSVDKTYPTRRISLYPFFEKLVIQGIRL